MVTKARIFPGDVLTLMTLISSRVRELLFWREVRVRSCFEGDLLVAALASLPCSVELAWLAEIVER
jgi:hypothetical protein